jgi:hypothetical protein
MVKHGHKMRITWKRSFSCSSFLSNFGNCSSSSSCIHLELSPQSSRGGRAQATRTRYSSIGRERHEDGEKDISVSVVAVASPTAGYTIFMAIDVITLAGTALSLLEHQSRDLSFIDLVSGGLEALDTMGTHWKTAEQQLKQVKPRISTVMAHTTSGRSSRKAAFFFRKPLSSPYGLDHDIVYGISRIRYLQALRYGDKVGSEDDICEMSSQ